jgi:hypothetical protein
MTKRYRAPKIKDGELKAQWGKLPHYNPDMIIVNGQGVPKCDANLLYSTLFSERYSPSLMAWNKPFYEELESRGYDLTTLKFSIQKKANG